MATFHSVRFQSSELLNHYPRLGTKSFEVNNLIPAYLHHAITASSLYMVKPPQSASSNAVPNAIKAQKRPASSCFKADYFNLFICRFNLRADES